MAEGTVKWFSDDKGYGFIEQDGEGDLFVHHSFIKMLGFRTLKKGDRVTFEAEVTEKGRSAKNVRKI